MEQMTVSVGKLAFCEDAVKEISSDCKLKAEAMKQSLISKEKNRQCWGGRHR